MLPQLSQKTVACSSYLSCTHRVKCHDSYSHGAGQGAGFQSHSLSIFIGVLFHVLITSQGSHGKALTGCSQENLCNVALMERGGISKLISGAAEISPLLWTAKVKHIIAEDMIWVTSLIASSENAPVMSQVSLLFCTDKRHNCTHAHTHQPQDDQARCWLWNYLDKGHMLWIQDYDFNYIVWIVCTVFPTYLRGPLIHWGCIAKWKHIWKDHIYLLVN